MKGKIGRLLRRSKSKPDLHTLSLASSSMNHDKPYAECVVNRAALALDDRFEVESGASGSDSNQQQHASYQQQQPVTSTTPNGSLGNFGVCGFGGGMGLGGMGTGGGGGSGSGGGGSSNGGGGGGGGGGSQPSTLTSNPSSSVYGGSGGAYTITPSVVSGLSNMDQQSTAGTSTGAAFDARKLVIQYFLQDAEPTFVDDGRRKSLGGAGMAVKVKARVENAPLTLEDNLRIQLEEDRRALAERESGERRYPSRLGGFVHCVAPPSANIDASDAIGLVSNYVVAYRALHRTCDRPLRRHDKVLVTNAHGSLGRSLVELALLCGASVVFGTAPPKYHERLSKWGATPLDADDNGPNGWSDLLLGTVDIVIDTDAGDACPAAPLVANQGTGKLVRILTGPNAGGDVKIWRKKNSLMDQPVRTTFYDVFHDMEIDPSGFRSDLQMLFNMMYEGSIRPRKKKAIPLLGVSYIEVRFDRFNDRPAADATSSSSKNTRSKSVGSIRSSGGGSIGVGSGRSSRSGHSKPRLRPPVAAAASSSPSESFDQQMYSERRSKSAPRLTSSSSASSRREWDDAADEIARANAAAAAAAAATTTKSGNTRSSSSGKERSRSAPRHRPGEDDMMGPYGGGGSRSSSSSRHRGEDGGRMMMPSLLHRRSSSVSSGEKERSKSVPRTNNGKSNSSNGSSSSNKDDGGSQQKRDRRSKSAPRVRGGRGGRDDGDHEDASRSSSLRRKMKSGRTDRVKSAPRERWNDENDGGVANNRYNDRDSPKSYRSRESTRKARVFDFSFW